MGTWCGMAATFHMKSLALSLEYLDKSMNMLSALWIFHTQIHKHVLHIIRLLRTQYCSHWGCSRSNRKVLVPTCQRHFIKCLTWVHLFQWNKFSTNFIKEWLADLFGEWMVSKGSFRLSPDSLHFPKWTELT